MAGITVLLMAYVLSQFYRSFLAVLSPILTVETGMSAVELSNASAAWFLVFALAQFPIGSWLDRLGPRRTAAYLLLVGGAGGIAMFAVAQSGWVIILAMALIGLGCAPVLMAAFFVFAHDFTPAKFATLAATFVGLGTLGNVLGSSPLAEAVDAFGWRQVAVGLSVLTALVAGGILVLVKDPEIEHDSQPRGSILDLFKIRELWLIFPMVAMGYSVVAGIRGLWAGPYLADIYQLDTTQIGRVTFYMAMALVIGSLCFGPLDRIFNSRKWVIVVSNAVVLVAITWLYLAVEPPLSQVTLCLVAIGFFGAGYAVQIAHGRGFVPKHLTGRGVTLLNFFSIGGAGVMQILSGTVVGTAAAAGGKADGYSALYLFYAIMLGLALFLYLFSKDSKPNLPA